jgi:O-antigen/teichoic acid export membrane protein
MGLEVMAIGIVMLLQMWIIRRRRFRALAHSHVVLGATRGLGQIGAGVLHTGFFGLGLSEVISRVAVVGVLVRETAADLRIAGSLRGSRVAHVAWRYRHFPMFRTPSTLANNIGSAMPPALVTMAYGVSSAGLYMLMSAVIVAPSGLVQKAVGDVFLGHFAERFRTDRGAARRFLLGVAMALVTLSIIPAVLLWGWGPAIFAFLFGEKWRAAGRLAGLMSPLLIADFTIGPLGGTLNVANRPELKLLFDVTRLCGFAAAYLLTTHARAPLESMVQLFAVFGVIAYVVYGAIIYLSMNNPRPAAAAIADHPARSGLPLP